MAYIDGIGKHAVLVCMATLITACGGGGTGVASDVAGGNKDRSPATATSVIQQPPNTAGRLLASNCFQCHGTLGRGGFDSIRGKDVAEVVEFLRKPADSNIMAAHAQGYTTAQLQAIVGYLQQ